MRLRGRKTWISRLGRPSMRPWRASKRWSAPRAGSSDPHDVEPHLVEPRGLYHGATRLVVRPASTEEVAAVVKLCAAAHLPIVPQGGNTGLVGAQVPPEDGNNIVLSLARMNRIRAIDPAQLHHDRRGRRASSPTSRRRPRRSTASSRSASAPRARARSAAISRPMPAASACCATATRAISCSASRWCCPTGRSGTACAGLRKDNTGYDLKQLFIGAEGTLGIITAAVLKLFPRPREVETAFIALAGVDDVDGGLRPCPRPRAATSSPPSSSSRASASRSTTQHLHGTSDPIAAAYPWYVLLEISSSQASTAASRTLLERLPRDRDRSRARRRRRHRRERGAGRRALAHPRGMTEAQGSRAAASSTTSRCR